MNRPARRKPLLNAILFFALILGVLPCAVNAQESTEPDTAHNEGDAAEEVEPVKELVLEPSLLSVGDVEQFMGTWDLTVDFQENKVPMSVQLIDVEGFAVALIHAIFTPVPIVVSDVTKTEDGILLRYEADFGDRVFTINVLARLEGESLSGTFSDEGGFISADFVGVKGDKDILAIARKFQAERPDDDDGGRPRRRGTKSTKLTIDNNQILVRFDSLRADGPDHASLSSIESGKVFAFVSGRAFKLMTDADLKFGDVVVKAGNAADNYPGVYSIWLKKDGDKWNLVFNEHADIWGTQHDPAADVFEIPLTLAETEAENETFTVELTEESEGGLLRLAWGQTEWTARFTLGKSIKDAP